MIILEELHQLYKYMYVCLVGSYHIATKVSSFTAHILLVTVAPLLYVSDITQTLSLSGLQSGHSNQCVKLEYPCTAQITAWMGADSALKHAVYNYSVKNMQKWRFTNKLTFAFMRHPYLVCIVFGMPSLHLSTVLMFAFSFFHHNLSYSQTELFKCNHNVELETALTVQQWFQDASWNPMQSQSLSIPDFQPFVKQIS